MNRRSAFKNYTLPGIYHITVKAADALRSPFGKVVGDINKPDGDAEAPRMALSPVGQMVEQELLHSIAAYYPMVEVQDYVIMPEHMHFIVAVRRKIVNRQGREAHLGQVTAGFKLGCNHRWWKMTGQQMMRPTEEEGRRESQQAEPVGTRGGLQAEPVGTRGGQQAEPVGTRGGQQTEPVGTRGGLQAEPVGTRGGQQAEPVGTKGGLQAEPAGTRGGQQAEPIGTGAGRLRRQGPHHIATLPSLFQEGYCDVMPVDAAQLEQQREYIKGNPRSRLMRTSNREWLQPQRDGIDTALTVSALCGYLQRECAASLCSPEALETIKSHLLTADGKVACDTYGDHKLLERKLLPVICHRKDGRMLASQQTRCLEEAARGAVLVSPRIAKGEQAIMDEAVNRGFATIAIADNGFPEVYHPSTERIGRCAEGLLLLVTPWKYHYRRKDEGITVLECKTMNCLAQALCCRRDDWWKR